MSVWGQLSVKTTHRSWPLIEVDGTIKTMISAVMPSMSAVVEWFTAVFATAYVMTLVILRRTGPSAAPRIGTTLGVNSDSSILGLVLGAVVLLVIISAIVWANVTR